MVKMLRSTLARAPSSAPAPLKTRSQATRIRGTTWQTIRDRILTRDAGLCQVCRAAGRLTLAAEVDHVRPLCEGGSGGDDNLQAICTPCHKAKTAAEVARQAG